MSHRWTGAGAPALLLLLKKFAPSRCAATVTLGVAFILAEAADRLARVHLAVDHGLNPKPRHIGGSVIALTERIRRSGVAKRNVQIRNGHLPARAR
jgi:hypothetical protein